MVSTDTAGASEIVFALSWTLSYRWAPRLADLPDQRLWYIHPHRDYGPLAGLARHRVNTRLIAENWDQICRLAPHSGPAQSPRQRSCGPCNAARNPPLWPVPWPSSDA